MRKLELREEAEIELFEATLRYERERDGLGVRFASELDEVLGRARENPLQFPEVEQGVRRGLTRTFPYGVFFVVEDDVVTVLAVLHLHRLPGVWKGRR